MQIPTESELKHKTFSVAVLCTFFVILKFFASFLAGTDYFWHSS